MEKIIFESLPSTDTPITSTNLNQMQDNMEDAIIPIKLVTISDSAPSSATTGDMYYNTTDNKVYTATGTNTWDSGSTPRYDGFYINTSDNTLFYYNGSTLMGVGGSGSGIGGDTLPVGMIMPGAFPSTAVVEDWLKCDGSAISRTEYSELFSAIGVSYGNGDGSTTFNLPNISGKMIIGYDADDTDFDTIGDTGGSKTHTQTVDELAAHSHKLGADNMTTFAAFGNQGSGYDPQQSTGTRAYVQISATTNQRGSGEPMDIMNPYIVMNYYIKAHQTAPVTATVKNEETTSETNVYSCNYINNITNKTIMKLNNATYSLTQTYTLEDDIEKYDFLYVAAGADSNYFKTSMLIKVSDIVYNNTNNNHSYMLSNYTTAGHFAINFVFPSKTQIKILDRNNSGWGNPTITEVYGIKL